MLELDNSEDELLTDAPHSSTASDGLPSHFDSSSSVGTPTVAYSDDTNSQHLHPLRHHPPIPSNTDLGADNPSRSASRAAAEGETRPRLARLLSPSAEETSNVDNDRGVGDDDDTTVIHKVSPTDSLPRVALHYGISVAALRRANQLWPSDPVHLRTELNIPRGDTPPAKRKSANSSQTHVDHISLVDEFPLRPSTAPSTLSAGHNSILSAFSARISLDSLSSRTSSTVSETHELDDLAELRLNRRRLTARRTPVTRDGYELSILRNSEVPFNVPAIATLPPLPCAGSSNPSLGLENPPPHRDRPRRINPSVFIPVRTSQLEPEPEMELPTRRHG